MLNQEQKVLIQIPTQSSYQGHTAHEMQQTAGLKQKLKRAFRIKADKDISDGQINISKGQSTVTVVLKLTILLIQNLQFPLSTHEFAVTLKDFIK